MTTCVIENKGKPRVDNEYRFASWGGVTITERHVEIFSNEERYGKYIWNQLQRMSRLEGSIDVKSEQVGVWKARKISHSCISVYKYDGQNRADFYRV